jgi:hypothetical protein
MVAMKVTKSQKVYFGLLIVGLLALGVDRFVLTPPAAQAADNAQALLVKPVDSSTGVDNAVPMLAAANIQGNSIADKLKELNDSIPAPKGEIRDAFTPGTAWVPTAKSSVAGSNAAIENFSQTHHLAGVLVAGRTGQAMVDGKDVLVGQTLDGFKLIAVKPGIAVFQQGDVQITLRIAKDR